MGRFSSMRCKSRSSGASLASTRDPTALPHAREAARFASWECPRYQSELADLLRRLGQLEEAQSHEHRYQDLASHMPPGSDAPCAYWNCRVLKFTFVKTSL